VFRESYPDALAAEMLDEAGVEVLRYAGGDSV
jgi:hypothetical protein